MSGEKDGEEFYQRRGGRDGMGHRLKGTECHVEEFILQVTRDIKGLGATESLNPNLFQKDHFANVQ